MGSALLYDLNEYTPIYIWIYRTDYYKHIYNRRCIAVGINIIMNTPRTYILIVFNSNNIGYENNSAYTLLTISSS